jgi:hypothetical protein
LDYGAKGDNATDNTAAFIAAVSAATAAGGGTVLPALRQRLVVDDGLAGQASGRAGGDAPSEPNVPPPPASGHGGMVPGSAGSGSTSPATGTGGGPAGSGDPMPSKGDGTTSTPSGDPMPSNTK